MPLGPTFATVLGAAQAGAPWAWERLYADLSGQLLGYLRGQGASDPENLLGEVFLQLARNLGGFRGEEPAFRSWVFSVAYHRVLDERRARRRRPTVPLGDSGGWRSAAGGDVEAEALTVLVTSEAIERVQRLTPDQRNVVLLRVFGDLTVEQVAEVLGRRPGAVKALQRRALAALARDLPREGVPL